MTSKTPGYNPLAAAAAFRVASDNFEEDDEQEDEEEDDEAAAGGLEFIFKFKAEGLMKERGRGGKNNNQQIYDRRHTHRKHLLPPSPRRTRIRSRIAARDAPDPPMPMLSRSTQACSG